MAYNPDSTATDDYYRQKNERELYELATRNVEAAKAKEVAVVEAEGQAKAAKIKTGTNVALAGIKAYMRQQQINNLKKAQMADAAALRRPTLTDKDFATASGIQSSAMRQAKAEGGRGGGGIDYERMRMAEAAGLRRGAQAITALQSSAIANKGLVAKVAADRSTDISNLVSAQREGIMGDAANILGDKDVVAMLGKSGKRDRETKADLYGREAIEAEAERMRTFGTTPPPRKEIG